jgi:heme exporter protein D
MSEILTDPYFMIWLACGIAASALLIGAVATLLKRDTRDNQQDDERASVRVVLNGYNKKNGAQPEEEPGAEFDAVEMDWPR